MAEIDALPSTGIVKAIERIGGYEQALVEGLGNFQNWRREVGEPQEERLAAAEVAKYERLKDTPFSKMAREDQALMLGMTIEDLQEQGGGFSFRELEQLGPLVAGAEGYLPVMGLTPTQWKAGGGDIAELEEWAIRGYGAERYRDVSESLGMGRRFSLDISRRIGRMAEPDQERRLQAMQQRAGRLRFGVSQQEILEKTMPHGGGPAQWGKLTGPQGQQAVMAEGVAAQAAQLMGVPMFSQESRALMEWLDTQPVDIQEQFAMAMPAAAQVGQAKGVDQLAMRSIGLRYSRALQRPGVTTQAVGLAAQIDLGQGAVWSALGGLPGMGQQFERPMMQALLGEQGQLNTQQYGQMAGMMQFGRGQMGYSMMAGAFGIGRQLRGAFGQTPLGMPFGEALIDAQGYSVGQLEGRDLRRGFQLAGFGRQFEQFGEQRAGLGLQVRQQAEAETYQLAGMTLQRAQAVTMRSFTIELQGLADNMKSVNRDFQELQWDFAIESRQLARGQQADTMALQRRGQLADVSYQRQMMGFQRGQQLTQQGWRQEDVAWGRGMAGFQYEYQMGELERGMRLSGGQEREQLWRRREYMEETYARQESRRGVEEGRLGQQMDWENQLFVMQSTHFEQQVSRQDQQYQMTLSHLMERYSLEDEQFQAQMSHTREVWVLQDQMTAKQREAEAARYEFQLSEIDRTRAYYEDHVFPFQKERLGLQEQAITNAETYYKDTVIPYQNEMFDNQVRIETAHANYTEWQMGIYVEGGDLWNAVELLTRHWLGEFSGALDAYEPPAWLSGGQLVPDPKGDSEGAVSSGGSGDPLRTFLPIMIQSIIVRIGGQDFAATVEGIVDEYGNFHSQAEGWGDVY